MRSALPVVSSAASAGKPAAVTAGPRASLRMPVRGEAATGEAQVHGDEVGQRRMVAQLVCPAKARSAEPGASAAAADTDEGDASGASAKRGGEGHRS